VLVGWLEFNVPFRHRYDCIRDDIVTCIAYQCHGLNESSSEQKFPDHFAPGSESSRERIGQGPIGRFTPGSELAREQKGCESLCVHVGFPTYNSGKVSDSGRSLIPYQDQKLTRNRYVVVK